MVYCNSCWPAVHAWQGAYPVFLFLAFASYGLAQHHSPYFGFASSWFRRNHHVDDSVASNQRGLPQQLAATKFIQLAFLRLTKRWRACDLLTTTYPPRHMAVLLMMITRVWTRHHNLYMEISICTFLWTYPKAVITYLLHTEQQVANLPPIGSFPPIALSTALISSPRNW